MAAKKRKKYSIESSVRTLSLKCYAEQVEGYEEYKELGWTDDSILLEVMNRLDNTDLFPRDLFIELGIIHNRDNLDDDFWLPSVEKPHIHVWLKVLGNPLKLRTLFNKLGINGKRKEDEKLWKKHGAESISSSIEECALYSTHETADAIRDGKFTYDIEEVHTNLTREELLQLRAAAESKKLGKERSTTIELEKINAEAYRRGYELKDFDDWFFSLPFDIQRQTSFEKLCRNTYSRGMGKLAEEKRNLNRLSIFIKGEPGKGKTFSTLEALKRMNKKVFFVDGGKTGKFDNLKASHEALVIDDYRSENVLKMSDNYLCQAYRRQNNNPLWAGNIFISLNNKDFFDWVEECDSSTFSWFKSWENKKKDVETYYTYCKRYESDSKFREKLDSKSPSDKWVNDRFYAVYDRFYICEIEEIDGLNQLVCKKVSTRGTPEEQKERLNLFLEFQENFNNIIRNYVPMDSKEIGYEKINGGKGIYDPIPDFVTVEDIKGGY